MNRSTVLAAAVGAISAFAARDRVAFANAFDHSRTHQEPARSVWDSVYTDAQAARGDSLYKENCAKCHGATLAGTNDGNALTGANFLANWNGLAVVELYEKIRTTMPPEKPKSIAGPQLADIVAYLFAQNHFPSGTKTLTDSADALKNIKIVQTKP
jgi:S-disulfanyl-L-cysteine oxidoreductase SoxD